MFLYHWLLETEKRQGSEKALVYRDAYLSWRGLLERVDRRAQELRSFGIAKGNFVGLMLGNVPEFIILALALSKLETICVPMDPTLGFKELQTLLDLLPLRALITRPRGGMDPSTSPSVSSLRKKKSIYTAVQTTHSDVSKEPEVRKRLQGTLLTCSLYKQRTTPFVHPSLGPWVFLTTDGEGKARGVFRTEQNLTASVESLQSALSVQAEDRILALLPLCRASSFEFHFLLALRYGATLYVEEETLPARIIKLLREQEITVFLGNPRMYASLNQLPVLQTKFSHQNIRFLSGSIPLEPEIKSEFKKRFGPTLFSLYRTTEAGNISVDVTGDETLGRPFPGVEVEFRPFFSSFSAKSEQSTLFVRSSSVSQHFLESSSHPSEIGNVDGHGWLCTGDVGQFDVEGRIVLQGRADDLVKIEGNRVMLHEIDRCLQSHPFVREAKTSIMINVEQNPVLTAKVFCVRACRETELMDYCAQRLTPHKVPRRIEVKTGPLSME